MTVLGVFNRDPETGGFVGAIETLMCSAPIKIIPNATKSQLNPLTPDYRVFRAGVFDVGAGCTAAAHPLAGGAV